MIESDLTHPSHAYFSIVLQEMFALRYVLFGERLTTSLDFATLFNELPLELRKMENYKEFEKQLKNILNHIYYESLS